MVLDFVELINILPGIIMYILPGVIFWKVFRFISLKAMGKVESKSEWTTIILTSFLIMLPFNLFEWKTKFSFLGTWNIEILDIEIFKNIIILVCSLFVGIIFGFISKDQRLNEKFLAKFFNRTLHDDDMTADMADPSHGMYIKLTSYTKKIIVFGSLRRQYNYRDDVWFKIQAYKITYIDHNSLNVNYADDEKKDKTRIVHLKLSDYDIVELTYSPKSLKIK
jgi:hypothetical protein